LGGAGRRLLASSAAYRARTRRLLVRKLREKVAVTRQNAGAALEAVRSLSSAPQEVDAAVAEDAMQVLTRSVGGLTAQMLQAGAMQAVAETANSVLSRVPEIRNMFVAGSLRRRMQAAVRVALAQYVTQVRPSVPRRAPLQ
jgi:hypothetical protein